MLKDVDLKDIKTLNFDGDMKFPNLCYFLYILFLTRYIRAILLLAISTNFPNWPLELKIYFPLIYNRSCQIHQTGLDRLDFWRNISEKFGWGWYL